MMHCCLNNSKTTVIKKVHASSIKNNEVHGRCFILNMTNILNEMNRCEYSSLHDLFTFNIQKWLLSSKKTLQYVMDSKFREVHNFPFYYSYISVYQKFRRYFPTKQQIPEFSVHAFKRVQILNITISSIKFFIIANEFVNTLILQNFYFNY